MGRSARAGPFSRSHEVSTTRILLELGSVILLVGGTFGLGRILLRPAAQRADRKMAVSRSAENASRLLVVTAGLSVMMALFAVIWRITP
jgi:hypothetical protein